MASFLNPAQPLQAAGTPMMAKQTFTSLDGWAEDDHEAAFQAFGKSCEALHSGTPSLRPAKAMDGRLAAICNRALRIKVGKDGARRFFEAEFEPWLITTESGTGLLTGYYEPEFQGSLEKTSEFSVPLLARPDDLETIPAGESRPGIDESLQAARRLPSGFAPYPDRAAIESGALGDKAVPLLFLRRPSEAFIIQVQGSARIALDGGGLARVAYAGRNGQPYTSIGRLLIEQGAISPDDMSLERLMGWLDGNPEQAKSLMHRNKSYIFFRIADELKPEDGPIGGAGTALVPGRSLAVDRRFWSYGLPFWLDGQLPVAEGREEKLQRLMIAHDTGSAILGPARGDFFFGSGVKAGTRAGLMRHQTRFTVLLPKGWQPE